MQRKEKKLKKSAKASVKRPEFRMRVVGDKSKRSPKYKNRVFDEDYINER